MKYDKSPWHGSGQSGLAMAYSYLDYKLNLKLLLLINDSCYYNNNNTSCYQLPLAVDATSTALQLIYLATSTAATGSAINI